MSLPFVWEYQAGSGSRRSLTVVQVNRASWEGEYLLDRHNRPLNIRGRTGLAGRGALGKDL